MSVANSRIDTLGIDILVAQGFSPDKPCVVKKNIFKSALKG